MSEQKKFNVLKGRIQSLDGARLIGTGAAGQVYLLPDDNVVKVLYSTDYKEAEREILLSKWAFSKGIATAISYDVADVDGHPGLVYESLGRDNLRNHMRDDIDKHCDLLKKYLEFIHSVNEIEVEEGQLPSAKQLTLKKINGIRKYFTDEENSRITALIETVPEDDHLVHGDCHIKNIKYVDDQLFLIDLDTLSMGDPIFELQGLCCCYHAYNTYGENEFNTFFEIDNSIVNELYRYVLENYYPGLSDEEKKSNACKIELLTYICMLHDLDPNTEDDRGLFEDMLCRVRERLYAVDDLILEKN